MKKTKKFILAIALFLTTQLKAENNNNYVITIYEYIKQPILNKKNVMFFINKYCKHPKIVYKQVMFETGHLTSKICLKNNNLFGMKHPSKRQTLSLGKKNNHAFYKNWVESIKDYALYQSERNILNKNEKEYINFLQKTYSSNKQYSNILSKIAY
jgi:uncharacterized FlgJ-related protein